MSRLQDELQKRTQEHTRSTAEQEILKRYESRTASFKKLMGMKDFKEYLKLEEEMNNPMIVIAHKCSDPVCESLKRKIRDFQQRKRVLEKVAANGRAHQ